MANIADVANDKQLCWMDFLINDIMKDSLKQAMSVEHFMITTDYLVWYTVIIRLKIC